MWQESRCRIPGIRGSADTDARLIIHPELEVTVIGPGLRVTITVRAAAWQCRDRVVTVAGLQLRPTPSGRCPPPRRQHASAGWAITARAESCLLIFLITQKHRL